MTSDGAEKAEILSDYLKSVFTREDLSSMPTLGPCPYPELGDITITVPGVVKLLDKLNPNKASGPDELPARILKNFAVHLALTLTAIYNQTVLHGVLPDDHKCANVMPLFKNGNSRPG